MSHMDSTQCTNGCARAYAQARALGDYLVVCFAGDESLKKHKRPHPSIPTEHKLHLIKVTTDNTSLPYMINEHDVITVLSCERKV
jgi:hypothetical protein